jgi:hypothetical protein
MLSFEAWELLIATLSGFIVAFASEPIKGVYDYYRKKRRLKSAIYKEIAFIYDSLCFYENHQINTESDLKLHQLFKDELTVYELIKEDPLIFYDLKESNLVKKIYSSLFWCIEESKSNRLEDQLKSAQILINQIEASLQSKRFDKVKLLSFFLGLSSGKRFSRQIQSPRIRPGQKGMDR